MSTYVDTSALLRLVEKRGDVTGVRAAMADQPLASTLAELECWVSIHKRWHDGAIDDARRDELIRLTTDTLRALHVLAMNGEIEAEARLLGTRFPLRTLDALHLATASIAHRRLASQEPAFRFCTADFRQASAARELFGADRVDQVPPSTTADPVAPPAHERGAG